MASTPASASTPIASPSPPPLTTLTLDEGVLPLSDSKTKANSTSSHSRRLSTTSSPNLDKENQGRAIGGADTTEVIGHVSDGLVFLASSPKDTLSIRSAKRPATHAATATPTSATQTPMRDFVMQDRSSPQEEEELLVDTWTPNQIGATQNDTRTEEYQESRKGFGATPSSTTSKNSVTFHAGKNFWMKFLDPSLASTSDAGTTPRGTPRTPNSFSFPDAIYRDASSRHTPLGRVIQRSFTTGSPLSDASEYQDDDHIAPSSQTSSQSSLEQRDDVTPTKRENASNPTASRSPEDSESGRHEHMVLTPVPSLDGSPKEQPSPVRSTRNYFQLARDKFDFAGVTTPSPEKTAPQKPSWAKNTTTSVRQSPWYEKPNAEHVNSAGSQQPSQPAGKSPIQVHSNSSTVHKAFNHWQKTEAKSTGTHLGISSPFPSPPMYSMSTTPSKPSTCFNIRGGSQPKSDQRVRFQGTPTGSGKKDDSNSPQGLANAISPNSYALFQAREATKEDKATLNATARALELARKSLQRASHKDEAAQSNTPQSESSHPELDKHSDSKTSKANTKHYNSNSRVNCDKNNRENVKEWLDSPIREEKSFANGNEMEPRSNCSVKKDATPHKPEFHNLLQAWKSKTDSKAENRQFSLQKDKPTEYKEGNGTPSTKVPSATAPPNAVEPKPIRSDAKATNSHEPLKDDVCHQIVPVVESHTQDNASLPTNMADSDIYEESFIDYDEPDRAMVILKKPDDTYQILVGDTWCDDLNELHIGNVETICSNEHEWQLTEYNSQCECSGSVFSGNDDLISFFLPQMGMACTCGKQRKPGILNPENPTAIENILRPWQVEFLKSFGIFKGEQLVKARHRSAGILAKALRQWRRRQGMVPFKTSACGMAIDIWAKTCKIYVRSIRKQLQAGQKLLDRQPPEVVREFAHFLADLPAAPNRKMEDSFLQIEPESQMEV